MDSYPVSDSLRERLAGKVRGIPVGAGKLHGIGDGESAGKSAHLRQSADREGSNQPMSMRQGTIRRTHVPFLMLIEGGKL